MSYIGSLGEELLRAMGAIGFAPSRKLRLHGISDDAVRKYGIGDAAVADVMRAIESEPAMLIEVLDEIKFREPIVRRFLEKRAAVLRAQGAHIPTGHDDGDRQISHAGRGTKTNRGVHTRLDNQACLDVAQIKRNPDGEGHGFSDTQNASASAIRRMPGHAKRGASAIAAVQHVVRKGLLDTIMVNGQRLRDVTVDEALGAAEKMQTNAQHIVRICNGLVPTKLVGEQISDEEAESRAKVAA